MPADAYVRARKLMSSRRDYLLARFLGLLQSILVVVLLGVAALFVSLMSSRGEARFPAGKVNLLPKWVASRATGADQQFLLFDDTGIFPLIAGSRLSGSSAHRILADALERTTRVLPALRTNLGALTSLLAIGLVAITLVAGTAGLRRRVTAMVATDVTSTLRRQIHRQMYRLGQSSLPTEGVGPVINLWTREVNDIRDAIVADLDVSPRSYILASALVAMAVFASPLLTLCLAAAGTAVWLIARMLRRGARRAAESAIRDTAIQLCLLHEDLGQLRTVQVYGGGEYNRQRFDEHLDHYCEAEIRRLASTASPEPNSLLLYSTSMVFALGLLGYNVVVNDRISIASMLILLVSLGSLAYPIMEWLRLNKALRQGNRSARGIFEFLERKTELHQDVGAQFLNSLEHKIDIEDVSVESRSGKRLLDGATVEIPAGRRVSVIGLDEDSKLALACVLPRLIDPVSGRVRIDGHDLRDVTLESVRAQVGTVLQADLVFSETVMVNIGLGDPINSLPRIIEAAKVAHAHHFIQDLPHGYETVIGPLGHYLKTDEQFRIALARALLHDPSILIIEEPSTPIDEDTGHFIDDTLARLSAGRTLILLAHRLATIRSSDLVVVLHNGAVDQVGTPAQLQSESKLYRHLLYSEFNEFATGEIEAGQMTHHESVAKAR
jgi:ABC-type multidrug transport system fused ATPase/permease subunit